jgi:hypothetical protein
MEDLQDTETMLANRSKFREKSVKHQGWVRVEQIKTYRGFSADFVRHRKEHENYMIRCGSNRKSSGCSWTWPVAALLAGFPAIPGTGDRGERGKRKRTTRGFDFTSYLWRRSTVVAGI